MSLSRHRKVDAARLASYLQSSGLSYRTVNKSYIFDCPSCKKKEKLYLYRDGSSFVCWVCKESRGFAGRPEKALAAMTGVPYSLIGEAICGGAVTQEEYEGELTLEMDEEQLDNPDQFSIESTPDLVWPIHCLPIDSPGARSGADYLAGRGVPVEIAKEYDIRYSLDDKTVDFPVWVGDRLVGWQSRKLVVTPRLIKDSDFGHLKKRGMKVISTPEIPREHVLMFQNRIVGSVAVLCEGPIDALKAHNIGGNVATMGKEVSDGQINHLYRKNVNKVYIAFDPDAANGVDKLIARLRSAKMDTFLVDIPDGFDDIGDMSITEATEVIKAAPEVYPFSRMNIFLDF